MSAFIDERRADFGVEPICRTLGVSASAYYQRASGERCAIAVEDERLLEVIRATHEPSGRVSHRSSRPDFVTRSQPFLGTSRLCDILGDEQMRRAAPVETTFTSPVAQRASMLS